MPPGPVPKDSKTRQRRNKVATAAVLTLNGRAAGKVKKPELPKKRGKWNQKTIDWWNTIWESPMAGEYLDVDVEGLKDLAFLEDRYHKAVLGLVKGENITALAAEIRQQRQCFGLTPIDRRRLQWEIDRGEEADTRLQKRRERGRQTKPLNSPDPRTLLEAKN